MPETKPRQLLTYKVKYEITQLLEKGQKNKDISKKYGLPPSTVMRINRNKAKVLKAMEKDGDRLKYRAFGFQDVDEPLFDWFCQSSSRKMNISGQLLLERARKLARLLDYSEDESNRLDINWINRFKGRHGISTRTGVVSLKVKKQHISNVLSQMLRKYRLDDVFNVTEFGLFWKNLSNGGHSDEIIVTEQQQHPKDRLTILCGASALGEKLPLLIVGDHLMPSSFYDEQQIPVCYEVDERSCMTRAIFTEYVQSLDRYMGKNGRKVALFVKHSPAHQPAVSFTNVEIFLLPRNGMVQEQPMHAGIIRNIRQSCRQSLMKRENVDLVDVINVIKDSWEAVSKRSINVAFKHVGFDTDDDEGSESEQEELVTSEFIGIDSNKSLDKTIPVTETPKTELIKNENPEPAPLGIKANSSPTYAGAFTALQTLQNYFLQQDNGMEAFQHIWTLDEILTEMVCKHKQLLLH